MNAFVPKYTNFRNICESFAQFTVPCLSYCMDFETPNQQVVGCYFESARWASSGSFEAE